MQRLQSGPPHAHRRSGAVAQRAAPALRAPAGAAPRLRAPSRRHAPVCSADPSPSRGGPTGLDIEGHRPTSPAGWELMKEALRAANVRVLAPQEVVFAKDGGAATVVDVRPEEDWQKGHVRGAVSAPFYRPIQGWSPWQVARRVGYAAFGVFNGTEVNPDFAAQVAEAVGGDLSKQVVLYCSQGGSFEPTPGQRRGFQTRSLVAAYELVRRGHTSVAVMRGGFREWGASGREVALPDGTTLQPEPAAAQQAGAAAEAAE